MPKHVVRFVEPYVAPLIGAENITAQPDGTPSVFSRRIGLRQYVSLEVNANQ